MKRWLKITLIVIGVLLVGGIVWWRVAASRPEEVKTVTAEERSVTQEVTFTGKLRAKQRAELAFETTGTLRELLVDVGETVSLGQVLARLDNRGSALELARARASQVSLAEQRKLVWQDTETAATRVTRENTRILETDRQLVRNAKTEMDQAMEVWQQAVRESGDEASTTKARYSTFLAAQSSYRTAQQSLKQTEATTAKTTQTARASADEAKANYEATQQAARNVAGLSVGEADVALANLRLVKNVAVAPFDGVITAKNVNAGELASAGSPVVVVESVDDLEVLADIPESDITKLQLGMEASYTLDALADGRPLEARIVSIAPAAKVLDGVPTYEVVLVLANPPASIRPGMTTNVIVKTAHKEGVVAIPRRAVVRSGGEYRVRVETSPGTIVDRTVVLGVLGSDGFIEIIEGVALGEHVVLPNVTQ